MLEKIIYNSVGSSPDIKELSNADGRGRRPFLRGWQECWRHSRLSGPGSEFGTARDSPDRVRGSEPSRTGAVPPVAARGRGGAAAARGPRGAAGLGGLINFGGVINV